jgi:hypothetical protein
MSSNIRNFASIMVCVGPSNDAENRVALAVSLASRFGSRLIGVAAEEAAIPYLEDGLGTARPILVENARKAAMEDLGQAEANFRRGAGSLPTSSGAGVSKSPTRSSSTVHAPPISWSSQGRLGNFPSAHDDRPQRSSLTIGPPRACRPV